MKKVIVVILIIAIVLLGFLFLKKDNTQTTNTTNKMSVEEYEDESYLENIVKYKIINNTATDEQTLLVNVENDKDIESIKNLLAESDKIEQYSFESEQSDFYMIAYLFDNSAIKIEGIKNELKISSLDDKTTVEYYKLRLEDDIQEYLQRKYKKYAKNVKYFLYKENEKFGVIDTHKNIIIDAKYDEIKIINNTLDLFVCKKGNEKHILDINKNSYFPNVGEKIVELEVLNSSDKEYNDILIYESNKKYGLINVNGEKITESEYEKIYSLGYLKNFIVLEKEGYKKQLYKVSLKNAEILAEYDEFFINKNEETQEYIISGKNNSEEEQVVYIGMKNEYINQFPETLGEFVRVYENGQCFFIKQEVVPENENLEATIIENN